MDVNTNLRYLARLRLYTTLWRQDGMGTGMANANGSGRPRCSSTIGRVHYENFVKMRKLHEATAIDKNVRHSTSP